MNIKRWFQRSREDADLTEEIAAHIAHEIDRNLARGLTLPEARRQARLKFGSPRRVRETVWETNRIAWIEDTLRDLRHSARTLSRTPSFALVAICVMALGIGANTALFTVVRAVLLNPLPFRDPSRIIQLYEVAGNTHPFSYVAPGMYAAWKQQAPSVEQMGIYGTGSINLSDSAANSTSSTTLNSLPEKTRFAQTSWDLFPVLGLQPAVGRAFTQNDDRPQAPATVILTHALWMRRYGGDPAIIGKTIQLDSKPTTVLGVLPAWFNYPDPTIQLWTPLSHDLPPAALQPVDNHNYFVLARLRPGATLAQALAEVDTATKRVHANHPTPFTNSAASAQTLLNGLVKDARIQLYVLLTATICVLLIASLNVANLLLARSASRRKETSVRAALGGSRWRLVREQVAESAVLAVAAGCVALPFAAAATHWLVRSRPDLPRVETIHMDAAVLLFGLAMVAFTAVLAGLVPAFALVRSSPLNALQESSRANTSGVGTARSRKTLLALQIGLTVVLLTAAGLLLKSYQHLRSSDLGCITQNVLTMRFSLPDVRYDSEQKVAAVYEQLIPRIRALPGVKAAGLSTGLPGQGYIGDTTFAILEHPAPDTGGMDALIRATDPHYFQAVGIPLLRGRFFEDRERLEHAKVALVSQTFARQFFPGEDPIGKHLHTRIFGDDSIEIVGVVGDTLYSLTDPIMPTVYFPIFSGDWQASSIAVVAQPGLDATTLALPIQKILAQIDPGLPVADVLTMEQSIGKSTLDASFTSLLVLSFAIMALLLAAVGLYGVLSYLVTQRTREIGIRIALGAQRGAVLRRILLDGLQPAWVGLVLGLLGSIFAVRLIRSLLYGASPLDLTVFFGVALLLALVATIACAIPAWRASRLDPTHALRTE